MVIKMIYRTITETVLKSIKSKPVTLITGARQVGKSTLCRELVKTCGYNYVTLDNTRELSTAVNDPAYFLSVHKPPLIIDEIQKCKELFVEIESIVNEVKFKGEDNRGMYILTGSQAYNLMSNVTESMAGRVGIVNMSPLSLREIKGIKEEPFVINPEKNLKDALLNKMDINELYETIVNGFYPEIYDLNIEDSEQFYADYVSTYIERDVSQLINLKDKMKFQRFMEISASLTGEEYVYDTIANAVGVSVHTIDSWMSVLVAGNIVTLLEPFYMSSAVKRIKKRPKLIFNDTGLAAYLAGLNNAKVLQKSNFNGRFVETYIINEIIKSYKNNGIHAKFYYYRDSNQKEIDLIVENKGIVNLIECKSGVSFSLSDVAAFNEIKDDKYIIENSGIICSTKEPYALGNGYFAVPICSI